MSRPDDAETLEDLAARGLTVRSWNALRNAGIETAGEIRALSQRELLRIRNLGRRQVAEIGWLLEHGTPRPGEARPRTATLPPPPSDRERTLDLLRSLGLTPRATEHTLELEDEGPYRPHVVAFTFDDFGRFAGVVVDPDLETRR